MRIKFLIAGLLGLVSTLAFAQKKELDNAKESYDKYTTLSQQEATRSLAASSIVSAQTSIDKAAANPKTATLPQTYALKAAIYGALALRDTSVVKSQPFFDAGDDALKKAKEADTKGENKKMIDDANISLAQFQVDKGAKEYQTGKYDMAYKSFGYYLHARPDDTTAMYYTGLAASASKNYDAALENYNKLINTKYSKNIIIVYKDMGLIYLAKKDTTAALKVIGDAVQKYPTNAELRQMEIQISLQSGKQQEVLGKIQSAIANDPNNKELYYYAGVTYEKFGDALDAQMRKAKDPAAKASFGVKKAENFSNAVGMFKKALAIDPEYFEANLHIGYSISSPAIDLFNAAQQLPQSKQKEYDADIAKSKAQFEQAKPYILKAVALNPKSADALANLKTYYLGTSNMAEANATQKKIDALK